MNIDNDTKETKLSTDRQTDIDIAKGLLIISVVVGHIINFDYHITAGIKIIIYSFI